MERIIKAFNNSVAGFKVAFKDEQAFREDLIIFAIFFPIAIFSNEPVVEKAILILSLFLILIAELANTAIEAAIDRISPERHPLSKKAKDVASSVVLLALLNAGIVWSMLFFI